jgi:hypothetical protein
MSFQLNAADLKAMTPDQIVIAEAAGRLNVLLGMGLEDADAIRLAEAGEPITADQVRRLTSLDRHELVITAYENNNVTKENTANV